MSKTQGIQSVLTATIAVSGSLSAAVSIKGLKLAAVVMPTTWQTANITFAACPTSGGTFFPVYDDLGNEVTVTSPAASRIIGIDSIAGSLAALDWIKLRSGTNAVGVTQSTAAATTLQLILKG